MRRLSCFLLLCFLGLPAAGAGVIRCSDAAGNVSYTDGACPPGARPVARVEIPDPTTMPPPPQPAFAPNPPPASLPPQAPAPVYAYPPPAPAGPVIIDARGGSTTDSVGRPEESRWSDRGQDPPLWYDDGYAWPGVSHPPRPPRDMRPRIRSCDARTCKDTQGNHFDRTTGQLDRYRSIDGRTCQPVGTTVVCR